MSIRRCTVPPTGLASEMARSYRGPLPVIETERLRLHAPTVEDLPIWTEIYTDPGNKFGGPYTPQEAWTEFSYYVAGWLLHGYGLLSVVRKSDGKTIGFVQLGLEWEDDEPELGWMFAREARGFGFASEAAGALRDWALQLMPTFVSYVDDENAASIRVARKLNATRDAEAEEQHPGSQVWRHRAPQPEGEE